MCIRINETERNHMKTFLGNLFSNEKRILMDDLYFIASRGVVTLEDFGFLSISYQQRKRLLNKHVKWPTYFCRLFPVSVSH